MASKSQIAIILSRLESFTDPDISIEQYQTDSEIASDILWHAHMKGLIAGKVVADLGAGTGILGIGAILLGASKVYLVEKDKAAIKILRKNLDIMDINGSEYQIEAKPIQDFKKKADTVIMNPPFGTKQKHADRQFLESAFRIAPTIISFHKTDTKAFVKAISKDHHYNIQEQIDYDYPLKNTYSMHRLKKKLISVTAYFFQKTTDES